VGLEEVLLTELGGFTSRFWTKIGNLREVVWGFLICCGGNKKKVGFFLREIGEFKKIKKSPL